MSAADFGRYKARCSYEARHGGGGFEAAGSAKFVVGAAVGYAVGDAIRANQDFNDCMEANGWLVADKIPTDPQPMMAQQPTTVAHRPIMSATNSQYTQDLHTQNSVGYTGNLDTSTSHIFMTKAKRDECISSVHADGRYAELLPHLPNVFTGEFNIFQTMDDSVPSASEVSVISDFLTAVRHCGDDYVGLLVRTQPDLHEVLQQQYVEIDSVTYLLKRRQIAWGQWAMRVFEIQGEGGFQEASGPAGPSIRL